MFEDFDFELLESPEFKEDSVREELIVPILKRLGYSASPPNQICRSLVLKHPYVYIGSKQQKINIFPDYLMRRNGKPFFVLDAKSPGEDIDQGKNVEQAYSYAIHKDVRTPLFALCNGRTFALYHVSHWPALLRFPISDIENRWKTLAAHIGSDVVRRDATFYPDFGIGLLRFGLALVENKQKVKQLFTDLDIHLVGRVDEDTYSLQSFLTFEEPSFLGEETTFLGTFDFSKALLKDFFDAVEPKESRGNVESSLKGHPFMWQRTELCVASVGLACQVTDAVLSNDNEQYLPFQVEKFF